MWSAIANFFSAIGSALGLVKHRSELKNAPDVKAAAKAKQEQAAVDKTTKAVQEGDLEEIRKQAAE